MKKTQIESEFKLVGLERVNGENYMIATCEPFYKEETFKTIIKGTNEEKEGLWNYCSGDWGNKIATIKCDGFYNNGMPINPILIHIHDK